ncbi:hypothetical protein HDU87_003899 [Geranomyces variabilis]|uniref:Uncharacterized protein n=1 Tax=Geranomyces variabilis TaxID=109894 RepID=A0AAD5XQW5_9FUNG|nr:hypothetical protein HDU87_003899 [Geranomyces variabilis]
MAIQALDMQNQEMRSMGNNVVTSLREIVRPQNGAPVTNGKNLGYADSDSDSDSSQDFDTAGLTVDRILLLIERQNSKCTIYNDKVKRASRRINKLTRLLSRVASNQDAPGSRNGNDRPVADNAAVYAQPPTVAAGPAPATEAAEMSGPTVVAEPLPPGCATWKMKSRETIDSLYSFNVRNAGPLARKPRTLLMPPEGAEHGLAHTVIASTLDGKLHMFDKRHKRHFQSIGHEEMRNYWPEDMAWVTPTTLAVAAADKSCSANSNRGDTASLVPHQIALIYDCSKRKSRMTYKVQHLTENMPHDKGASVIYPFSAVSGDKTRWLTGGMDKRLFLWSYDGVFRGDENGAYSPVSHISVHAEHTAAIFAILYNPHSEILYTGGQDCRLVGWSFPGQKNVLPSEKREGRIRDLTAVPGQPHLMLIGFAENRKQLRLWDERTNRFVLELGDAPPGDAETSRADTTRYMHPSIHAGGYLVSMGHPRSGKIGIWDMRYTGVERAPTQQIEGHHTKRVIVAKFDEYRKQETLISISHDNTINFSDFKLSKGEECQDPGA